MHGKHQVIIGIGVQVIAYGKSSFSTSIGGASYATRDADPTLTFPSISEFCCFAGAGAGAGAGKWGIAPRRCCRAASAFPGGGTRRYCAAPQAGPPNSLISISSSDVAGGNLPSYSETRKRFGMSCFWCDERKFRRKQPPRCPPPHDAWARGVGPKRGIFHLRLGPGGRHMLGRNYTDFQCSQLEGSSPRLLG